MSKQYTAVFGESAQHKSLPSCCAVSSCMHNIVVYLVHSTHTCMCMYVYTHIYNYIYARNACHLKFIVHVFILHAHIVYICGCAETHLCSCCPKSHLISPGVSWQCRWRHSCPASSIDCRPQSIGNKLSFKPSRIWLRSPKPSIPCETVYVHKLTDRIVV